MLVDGFPFREVIVLSGQKRFFLKLARCLLSTNAARQEMKSEMRYKRDRMICGTLPSGNSSGLDFLCFLTRSMPVREVLVTLFIVQSIRTLFHSHLIVELPI